MPNYKDPNNPPPYAGEIPYLLVVKPLQAAGDPLLAKPKEYLRIWNDKGSGAEQDGSVFWPVAMRSTSTSVITAAEPTKHNAKRATMAMTMAREFMRGRIVAR